MASMMEEMDHGKLSASQKWFIKRSERTLIQLHPDRFADTAVIYELYKWKYPYAEYKFWQVPSIIHIQIELKAFNDSMRYTNNEGIRSSCRVMAGNAVKQNGIVITE